MILTTDFLIQLSNGEWEAYSVKPITSLKHDRTIQKQAIEKTYWELQGVKWNIVLDKQLKTVAAMNLNLLRHYAEIPFTYSISIDSWIKEFKTIIHHKTKNRTSDLIYETSKNLGIDYTISSSILFHCIWNKLIDVNLNHPIHLEKTPIDLGLFVNA